MYKAKQGWYKLLNPDKFIKPIDEHMESHKNGYVNYKSSLELSAIRYCDFNKHIVKFSLEPFAIKYFKRVSGKVHRYYIDLFIEFSNGDKFLVEVKSFSETKPPKKLTKNTTKSKINYQKALMTYYTNKDKWNAAEDFASQNDMKFIILTEKELKK